DLRQVLEPPCSAPPSMGAPGGPPHNLFPTPSHNNTFPPSSLHIQNTDTNTPNIKTHENKSRTLTPTPHNTLFSQVQGQIPQRGNQNRAQEVVPFIQWWRPPKPPVHTRAGHRPNPNDPGSEPDPPSRLQPPTTPDFIQRWGQKNKENNGVHQVLTSQPTRDAPGRNRPNLPMNYKFNPINPSPPMNHKVEFPTGPPPISTQT
ncbi:hypothetical protein CRENBAI_017406, partial [Crenichthys baileyi]